MGASTLGRNRDNSPHYWPFSLHRGKGGTTCEVGTPRYRVYVVMANLRLCMSGPRMLNPKHLPPIFYSSMPTPTSPNINLQDIQIPQMYQNFTYIYIYMMQRCHPKK